MTKTRHGQPTAPAFWQQQIVGLREGAVRVRRKLGRLRRALTASADGSTQAALSEDARTQLVHIGAETARLRTEVDALTDHLRLLTGDVARSEWDPILVGPPSNAIDLHVDTAPYTPIHLRLKVAGYTTTSVGLVVRRGA